MGIGVPNFYGQRLTEARVARGVYKNALADMIGVTPMAITRYEAGQDKPHVERLTAIADKLNFPIDFFLSPPFEGALGTVFWRSRANESKFAREMTEQRMKWLCQLFDTFEADLEFPVVDLPDLDLPKDFRLLTSTVIERAAESVRSKWGLGDHPIPDVILALENAGIPVVAMDIQSDKQDGFTFRSPRLGRPFVGINVNEVSAARARLDAAHELGHILLHQYVTPEQDRDSKLHRILELQAFRFAGAFLFPRDAFLTEVRTVSLDYFCALKKRWGMSIGAMIMRAFDLDLIDAETKSELYRAMGRRGWRGLHREPFDNPTDMAVEEPRMMRRALQALLDSGHVSRSGIRSALRLPDHEIEQIVGLPRGGIDELSRPKGILSPRHRNVEAIDLESGNVVEFPGRRLR